MKEINRDFSIDFIKGIAALSVVLLHNMPNYYIGSIVWIGQAVPLFLFVTAYLTYGSFERGKTIKSYYSKDSLLRMLNRVFKPFLIVTMVQCAIFYIMVKDYNVLNSIPNGGIGPGSYYPWLHLQAWFVLPFIILLVDRLTIKKSLILFIAICASLEIISSLLEVPAYIYRLSFYRYLFVLYLACIVKKLDIKISISFIVLAAISLIFLLVINYTKINFEPIFFNQWRGCHWLGYFYTAFIFLLLLIIYKKYKNSKLTNFFVLLGNYSYEIFLCQMFIYSFITMKRFSFLGNIYLEDIAFIITTTTLSILPILIYKLYIKKLLKR